jgi:hypothetical protein
MRRAAILAVSIGLIASSTASAAGIHLRWTNCVADGGTRNQSFACNSNLGTRALVTSYIVPVQVLGATKVSGRIDILTAGTTLPEWWSFKTCRSGSINLFSTAVGPILCAHAFCGGGFTAILPGTPSANGIRLEFEGCTPARDLSPGIEYIGPVVQLNFTRTVGTPSCPGCNAGACVMLKHLVFTTTGGAVVMTEPGFFESNVATWQAGSTPSPCEGSTPTRRETWGAIQSLYR